MKDHVYLGGVKIYKTVPWLIVAGVVFILVGIVARLNSAPASFLSVTAVITDIEKEYDADGDADYTITVAYTVDGTEYQAKFKNYNITYRVGKEVELLYDPEDPAEAKMKNEKKLALVLWTIGGLAVAAGTAGTIYYNVKIREEKEGR